MGLIKHAGALATVLAVTGWAAVTAMGAGPASAATTPAATPYVGEACVFNAPTGAKVLFGLIPLGHVGWGFKLADGNWEFGANEGPVSKKDSSSDTWYVTDSRDNMLTTFAIGPGSDATGYYKTYECVQVSDPHPSNADRQVISEQSEQFKVPFQDCEALTYNVLKMYGVAGLPNDVLNPSPNSWYAALKAHAGFIGPMPLKS